VGDISIEDMIKVRFFLAWLVASVAVLQCVVGVPLTGTVELNKYVDNYNESWVVNATYYPASIIELLFTEFDVETESQCSFDSLSVYDGSDPSGRFLYGKYCGTKTTTNDFVNGLTTYSAFSDTPFVVGMLDQTASLEFQSDSVTTGNGFKCEYSIKLPYVNAPETATAMLVSLAADVVGIVDTSDYEMFNDPDGVLSYYGPDADFTVTTVITSTTRKTALGDLDVKLDSPDDYEVAADITYTPLDDDTMGSSSSFPPGMGSMSSMPPSMMMSSFPPMYSYNSGMMQTTSARGELTAA
jgi:hypothetical protein